ncbi:MAG: hypothetical protein ABI855_08625 [Bacteroidota bacterium]
MSLFDFFIKKREQNQQKKISQLYYQSASSKYELDKEGLPNTPDTFVNMISALYDINIAIETANKPNPNYLNLKGCILFRCESFYEAKEIWRSGASLGDINCKKLFESINLTEVQKKFETYFDRDATKSNCKITQFNSPNGYSFTSRNLIGIMCMGMNEFHKGIPDRFKTETMKLEVSKICLIEMLYQMNFDYEYALLVGDSQEKFLIDLGKVTPTIIQNREHNFYFDKVFQFSDLMEKFRDFSSPFVDYTSQMSEILNKIYLTIKSTEVKNRRFCLEFYNAKIVMYHQVEALAKKLEVQKKDPDYIFLATEIQKELRECIISSDYNEVEFTLD